MWLPELPGGLAKAGCSVGRCAGAPLGRAPFGSSPGQGCPPGTPPRRLLIMYEGGCVVSPSAAKEPNPECPELELQLLRAGLTLLL